MPYNTLFPQLGYFNHRKGGTDWKFDSLQIDFHDVSYVVGGGTILETPEGDKEVGPGDLIYLPPPPRKKKPRKRMPPKRNSLKRMPLKPMPP